MRALIAAIVLLAGAGARGADAAEPPPSLTLWVQPLGTAFLLATGEGVYLPLGANLRASDEFDLQLELTVLSGARPLPNVDGGEIRSSGFTFTVGPLFRGRLFFLAPKIVFAVQKDLVNNPNVLHVARPEYQAVIAQLGADVGMELRAGGFVIGFATGASLGVCRGCSAIVFSPFGDLDGGPIADSSRTLSLSAGVNVNLLRAGVAF